MDPATITAAQWAMASFAATATTAVASYVGGQSQASAQNKAAWDNYNANQAIMAEQAKQIAASANNEVSERQIQAQIEQAKLRTVAGESGVAGNLVDRWFQDSEMQESRDIASIETNKSNRLKQNNLETQGLYARAQGQANEASSKAPSLLGTGLQIAGAGAEYGRKTTLPSKG